MHVDDMGLGTSQIPAPGSTGPRAGGRSTSRILLVEDTPEDAAYIMALLEEGGDGRFTVHKTDTLEGALRRVSFEDIDAVILDLCLPDSMGLATLERLQASVPSLPILVLTASRDETLAEESIRHGAQDYLLKEKLDAEVVSRAIRYAIERKRAEDALLESTSTLRTLVQASPLAIAVTGADRKLRIWNPAAERMFGWKEAEVLGRPLPQVTRTADDGLSSILHRTLQGDSSTGTEVSCVRRDGTTIDVSISTAPLYDAQSRIVGAMAVTADVTERRLAETLRMQLQDQLRQSQKMEAVGRLAGGIAHDFNNLMTAISGYAELLQGGFAVGDPGRDHVDEILLSSNRATALTRQLLAFSRRQVLQPRLLDLNAVTRGIDGLLRRLIGEHIELEMKLDDTLGMVKADQGQLEQVIINLTLNARDAMSSAGGRVTFETREVEIGPDYSSRHGRARSGRHVMLAVSDTGCGMDPATLSHLFEPFFTTKELGKGTGLGLATVYGIVKQSDGDIWVYSEPGIGTTFKIYLPLSDETGQATAPAPAAVKESRRGDETILLVEDSEVIRRLLRELLSRNGYRVLLASDGKDALGVAAGHADPIHLLVSDVIMPRLNGRELAQRLVPRRPDMKVLFMSGYTEDAIAKHGILDPGTHFLEKPFTHDAFLRKVRDILDSRREIR